MIKWERRVPNTIPLLESLLRRLAGDDTLYGQYAEKLKREKLGFYGEQRLDREWLDFRMEQPYHLLNGMTFENIAAFTHQIDTLFVCPYFIFVLEVKNIAGRIDINDETNQCIRTRLDGSVEGFSNPVDQVRRHGRFMNKFLQELEINLPVVCGVVFTNPYSIIGHIDARDVHVFQVSGLRYKMENLFTVYQKQVITEAQMELIADKLIMRRKLGNSWKPKFELERLRRGVLCSRCHYRVQMQYKYRKWSCPKCGIMDNEAFYEALKDYRMLWGERISNSEFREFFGIKSEKTAYRLLKSLNLESKGNFKGRTYIIPADINEMSGKNQKVSGNFKNVSDKTENLSGNRF